MKIKYLNIKVELRTRQGSWLEQPQATHINLKLGQLFWDLLRKSSQTFKKLLSIKWRTSSAVIFYLKIEMSATNSSTIAQYV